MDSQEEKERIGSFYTDLTDAVSDLPEEMQPHEVLVTIRVFDKSITRGMADELGLEYSDLDTVLDKLVDVELADEPDEDAIYELIAAVGAFGQE